MVLFGLIEEKTKYSFGINDDEDLDVEETILEEKSENYEEMKKLRGKNIGE